MAMPDLPATDRQLLTIHELSDATGVPVRTLRNWVRDGRIPFHQPAGKGGKLYFPRDAVERSAGSNPTPTAQDVPDLALAGRKPSWMK